MQVEIGALVHKDCGPAVLEAMRGTEGVAATMIETGRSNDLFDDHNAFHHSFILYIDKEDLSKIEDFNIINLN